jgi:type III secretion protein D
MIDSAKPLQLRILTGTHAGAEILLSQGSHTIGYEADSDFVLSDWPDACTHFKVYKNSFGKQEVSFIDESVDEVVEEILRINQPKQIGDIIFVAIDSNCGIERPSDLDLLKQILVPVVPSKKRTKIRGLLVGGIFVMLGTTLMLTLQTTRSVAATTPAIAKKSVVQQVKALLRKQTFSGIKARADGDKVVVSGLVKDQGERDRLDAQLDALHLPNVLHEYATEGDIVNAISDAVGQPGVTVKYAGNGRFELGGKITPDMRKKLDLAKLKNDLGATVLALGFADEGDLEPVAKDDAIVQSAEGYKYKQGPNGAKYFIPESVDQ